MEQEHHAQNCESHNVYEPQHDEGFLVDDVEWQYTHRIVRLDASAGTKLPPNALSDLADQNE